MRSLSLLLWSLFVPLAADVARGLGPVSLLEYPILEPGSAGASAHIDEGWARIARATHVMDIKPGAGSLRWTVGQPQRVRFDIPSLGEHAVGDLLSSAYVRMVGTSLQVADRVTCAPPREGGALSCEATIVPETAGQHDLEIALRGVHITGSPLPIAVLVVDDAGGAAGRQFRAGLHHSGRDAFVGMGHGHWAPELCCELKQWSEGQQKAIVQSCCPPQQDNDTTHPHLRWSQRDRVVLPHPQIYGAPVAGAWRSVHGVPWWMPTSSDPAREYSPEDAQRCLDGKNVTFVGDSFSRNANHGLCDAVLGPARDWAEARRRDAKSHLFANDGRTVMDNIRIDNVVETAGANDDVIAVLAATNTAQHVVVWSMGIHDIENADNEKNLPALLMEYTEQALALMKKLKAAFPLVVWRAIHAKHNEDVDTTYAWQSNEWIRRFNTAAKAAANAVGIPFMDTFGMSYAAGPEAHYQGIHLQRWYHIATAQILLNHICEPSQTGSGGGG